MHRWLDPVAREPRVPDAPGPLRRDRLLVAASIASAVVEAALRTDLPWRWPTLPIAVALLLTLPWRRTRPLPVTLACFGGMTLLAVVDLVRGYDEPLGLYTMSVLLISLFSLCRWGSGREILIGSAVALATGGVCIAADYTEVSDAIGGIIVLTATGSIALAIRFRGRSRQREIEQVRMVEREHLARDLHDTVAHHVSAIAIRAQAGLAVSPSRPEAAVEALQLISTEASRTLAEMRAMVGILRRDAAAELAPLPALADLGRLARSTGTPRVEVAVDPGLNDVAPSVATAIYRIAQEAVTNAQRHALGATRIEVRVRRSGGSAHVRVTDDGDPADQRRQGAGYGLLGMSERAALLGGSCTAAAQPGRGWAVDADLPLTGAA